MKGLGTRIKTIRRLKKLTLVGVAKSAGIDQATLSRIENEKMTGTLESHMQIAKAMGVRLVDIYDETLDKIHAAKEKAAKEKLETFSHSSGAVAELLTNGILQKKMTPLLLRIKPGGRTESEEYILGSERFIYLFQGSLEVHSGREKKDLEAGDSLYFNASQSHHFRNTSKTEAVCLSVLTPSSL